LASNLRYRIQVICVLLLGAVLAYANEALLVDSVAITGADPQVNLETQVGRPYNALAVQRDVRHLYSLGRFDDVRVELTEQPAGAAIHFVLTPKPRLRLHEIRLEPSTFGFHPSLPEGSAIDDLQAQQLAGKLQNELKLQGYQQAHVSYEFVPAPHQEVDLRLKIESGPALRVKDVQLSGSFGLRPKQLRASLSALHAKTMIPLIWRLRPDYSREAIDADVSRLRSLYLSQGYFDARVTAAEPVIQGKDAIVRIEVDSGPRYQVRGVDLNKLCSCMLAQRRDAERQGILDFNAAIHVEREGVEPIANVTTKVELGQPFRVHRIEFYGLHRYSNDIVRRNFLLDEGDLLDRYLVRKSLSRVMDTHLFNELESRDIVIQRDDNEHTADIKVRLTERKAGSWNLSGPVGPPRIGGAFQASLMSRLPPWGRGIFELSTYTVSASLLAFAQPIIPGLAVKKFVPIFALSRGFIPGASWTTGFVIAPQVGWQGSLMFTGAAQLQGRLLPMLTPNRGLIPELNIAVEGDTPEGAILCQAPKPRLHSLRTAAAIALHLEGSFLGL
jgi:outer membrane protein assembly factor BamA